MNEYDRMIATLHKQGERLTIQRRLVIAALSETHAHMTISDIGNYIMQQQPQALPEPTIYRILQWLKDLGMISQTDMAEAGTVYQIIGASRHHHLICLNCGQTTDVPDRMFNELRQSLLEAYGFQSRMDHMAIYGLCKNCSQQG